MSISRTLVVLTACASVFGAVNCASSAPDQPQEEVGELAEAWHKPKPKGNQIDILATGYVKAIPGRQLVPGVDEINGGRLVASTTILVRGPGFVLIGDPGFIKDRHELLHALKKRHVKPKDVTHIFISHHHPDHTTNIGLFPHATIVDFWATYKDDLWEDHPDHYEIASGVKVVRTPGHTREDASLVIQSKGATTVFTHVWWDETFFPPADPIGEDAAALEASRAYVLSVADCIIPGHGKLFQNPQGNPCPLL